VKRFSGGWRIVADGAFWAACVEIKKQIDQLIKGNGRINTDKTMSAIVTSHGKKRCTNNVRPTDNTSF
jgi:hypothetical protein